MAERGVRTLGVIRTEGTHTRTVRAATCNAYVIICINGIVVRIGVARLAVLFFHTDSLSLHRQYCKGRGSREGAGSRIRPAPPSSSWWWRWSNTGPSSSCLSSSSPPARSPPVNQSSAAAVGSIGTSQPPVVAERAEKQQPTLTLLFHKPEFLLVESGGDLGE